MYNNNTINEGYKTLSPEAQKDKKQVEKYNEIQKLVELDEAYVDFPDAEDLEYFNRVEEAYLKKHPEDAQLFEDFGQGWHMTSPFDWIKTPSLSGLGGLLGKIFAPIKWLAALCAAGIALLLAAIWKALKEGNKQLAILKVRKWIESMVVTADGGYKKQRKSKDSLYLIEARARRDVLQAAVMAGYAAGIDIPQKNNEPANPIESAKNESLVLGGMDGFLFEADANTLQYVFGGKIYNTPEELKVAIGNTPNPQVGMAQNGVILQNQFLKPEQLKGILNTPTSNTGTQTEQTTTGGMDGTISGTDASTGVQEPQEDRFDLDEIKSWSIGTNQNAADYPNTPEGIQKLFKDVSTMYLQYTSKPLNTKQDPTTLVRDLSVIPIYFKKQDGVRTGPVDDNLKGALVKEMVNLENNAQDEMKQRLNQSYEINTLLPDDSQVDWSLMRTLKTSKWFGFVKHKTDLWAEARSAGKIKISEVLEESQRQQYITNVLTNVNAALSKITTPAIAKNYANVINQFNQQMMQRTQTSNDRIPNTGQAASTGNLRVGNHSTNESIDTSKYPMFADDVKMFEAGGDWFTDTLRAGMEYNYGRDQNYEIDYDKSRSLIDNTFKASQNIFTSASVNEFLIFTKTRDQMTNFLNELTKSVHLIIDSVAKKAQQQNSGNNDTAQKAIMNFLTTDSGDPKQNRSLTNLWDNIARPKLDSRAITRLFELTSSPEFVYFIQMLTKTIPMCVMTLYMPNDDQANKCMALIDKNGMTLSPLDALKQQADKNLAGAKGEQTTPDNQIMADTNTGNQNADQDKVNQTAQQHSSNANQQPTPQPQPTQQNSSVQYTMNDFLNENF